MSALYQKLTNPNEKASSAAASTSSVFPRIVSPEMNLSDLFLDASGVGDSDMEKSALSLNLMARQIHLNLNRLRQDYVRMRALEAEVERLDAEKSVYTTKISKLIKESNNTPNPNVY